MNSYKYENSKDSETKLGIKDIWGQRRKGNDRVLYSRSENGQFIGS